ncbi:MAG: hypothetical protein D6706_17450 [Chloroflexi bacterium]|nr:MAG: hypothetical protein D6706_17450 [Chloroflexota bacterium]
MNTLPAESIEELIRQRLKVSVLPKSVVELVHSRAEGNPFFTEEVVFMLLDQGVIRIRDKVCEIVSPDLKRLQFPSTVRGIITSRVDKLEPREQLTLKVASVIGRAFSYRVLYDVHPVPDDRPLLRHYLDDLQQRNITLLETPEPNLSYLFKHAITWETVYDLMTFSQRHEFHRQVALWYEHTYAENLTSYYPLLVYHWQRAEDWEKTRDYLEKAGTQALTNYANEEAVQFFSQVLELADTGRVQVSLATKAEWLVALAEALFNLGDILESQKILEKALAALGWPVPAGNGRFAFSLLSQTIQQIWHRLRRYGYHNRLSSETQQQIRRAVYAYELYGRNSYFMDDTRHLLYASIRGLNLAEQGGPSLELARAYSVMSVIAGVIPLHRLARFYAQRAVEIINSTHDKTTRSFVLSRVNIYNIGAGLWSSVREQVAQAIQDADELGAKTQWLESVGILAWFNNFAGNYDDGFHWGQVYHQWSETIGNERSIVWGLTLQAFARLHQGKIQEAIPLLEEGYAFSGQHEDRIAQIINQGVLAQAYFLAGDVDKAWKIGHKTFALMSESPLPAAFTAFDGYLALAEMLLDLQETYQESAKQIPASELDSMIKQTSKWLNGFARRYPICVPGALRIAGRVAWLEGNRQKAFRLWRKSLARATAIGMPYDEGIVHLELGRRLDVSNSARIYHLQMAYENLARIHADYGLRMVEKSLALESR